ncbi:MAG: hypothetical protein JWL86_2706 [Rhizobium sp.]|nr:hypothetical protein [Rhizobium sp.]
MPILRTATLCLFAILAGSAQAQQQWPDRQIKIVVGFPPGPLDIVGRPVAQKLQEALGQPVIFENRPGANGTIATELVMRSEPDGYTILLGTAGTHVTAVHLFKNLRYDPVKDFMPIVAAVEPATCLVVSSALPIKSVAELIAYSKANPGKLSYGSTGVGSVFHLLGELFNQTTGSAIVHVPYKGADGAINDVIAGHLPLAFTAISTAGPHIQAGTVRILAITEPQRFSRMPDVPSITETIPAFKKPSTWMGFFAPLKTPEPIIKRLNAEIDKILMAPEMRARMEENGYAVIGGSPEDLHNLMVDGIDRFGKIVNDAGIKPE